MQRKGRINISMGLVVFLIVNLAFLALMIAAVAINTNNHTITEEVYAKKIALLIDGAKPGTIITVDIGELVVTAREKRSNPTIDVDCESNEVRIKLSQNSGFSHSFYTDLTECDVNVDIERRQVRIKV